MHRPPVWFWLFFVCTVSACATTQKPQPKVDIIEQLKADAAAVTPLLHTPLARSFAAQAGSLPHPGVHVVWKDKLRTRAFTNADYEKLSMAQREGLERAELDEEYFYTTRYGSPLSYTLPLDVLAAAGLADVRGVKLLDYGYGYVSHLKMLSALGADAAGIDVDAVLPLLYGADTSVHLYDGRFPEDAAVTAALGDGYDLFLSKNVLKMGYVHPPKPTPVERTLNLKVTDDEYVQAVAKLLKPRGWALVYNIYPAQKPEYIPWAEGKTPFAREVWERAGFEVLDFDRDDTPHLKEVARSLGCDKGEDAIDLEHDLFATYTLVRKR